jgi:hypothetical protein
MAIREQGIVVQHAPLGSPLAFLVSSTPVGLPDLPPLDRIKRVLIHSTEDLYWRDDGGVPSVDNGQFHPSDAFLVYDATGAGDLQLVAAGADATVRITYHGI